MLIAKGSQWQAWRKDVLCTFQVVGIWGTGGGEQYQTIAYDLQPVGSEEIINISRELFLRKIERKEMILIN